MSDRPKRRSVLRKTAVPDATHYVGYVEDEETPEMIMKKFEEMERIRAAHSSRAAGAAAAAHASASSGSDAGPSSAAAVQPGPADEGTLDREQLHAIFKATSLFNVKSLLGNNEALMVGSAREQERGHWSDLGNQSGSEDELVAGLQGFWSDDDWGKTSKGSSSSRHKRSRCGHAKQAARSSQALQRNQRTSIITQYNRDTHAFIRRRMRLIDPDAILQLRLPPPPLPLSWGKAIKPFRQHRAAQQQQQQQQQQQEPPGSRPAATAAGVATGAAVRRLMQRPPALPASRNCDPVAAGSLAPGVVLPADCCEVHVTPNMSSFAFSSLRVQHYQAVLINTGWEVRQQQAAAAAGGAACVPSWSQDCAWGAVDNGSSSNSSSSLVVQRLAALPIPELCPRGFIMIWANKEHLSGVVGLMSRWGYSYVENLTWVLLAPNHSILRLPSHYVKRSHITLYIFRKDGEGRDIELRHQRNPDVVFDCVRCVQGREWDVPEAVFSTIETLLPTGKGMFLELWAPSAAGRAGWTHIVEQQLKHSS